jgi:hypothetical protein
MHGSVWGRGWRYEGISVQSKVSGIGVEKVSRRKVMYPFFTREAAYRCTPKMEEKGTWWG